MTFAIFALAEALPHHDVRHTLDGLGGPAGLTPEIVLPTGELDRVKRQGSFCLSVVKKCAGFTTTNAAWTGNFTRVDKIMFDVDEFLHEQIADCPKVKTESEKQKLRLYQVGNGSKKQVWVPQMLPQTCERLKKIRKAYPVYDKNGNGFISVTEIRHVINYYGGQLNKTQNSRMIRDFSKFDGQVPNHQDPNMVRYRQDPNMVPNYHQDPIMVPYKDQSWKDFQFKQDFLRPY